MTDQVDGTGGVPPRDRPFARDEERAEGRNDEGASEAAPAATERSPGADKAEPEKARAEVEAGDVADDLADFA